MLILLYCFIKNSDDTFESEIVVPEKKFKIITYFIVISAASISILVPNSTVYLVNLLKNYYELYYILFLVEFVLSLTGATTGSLICYVWPSLLFIYTRTARDEIKDIIVNVLLHTL